MAYQAQDWTRAQQAYAMLERYLPDHLSVLYNHALVLAQLKQFDASADRLRYIATREPANYAAQINLYWAYSKGGREKEAKRKIAELKKMFPADTEVAKLAGG